MAKPLTSGFKLNEGSFGDSDEIWQLCEEAFKEDAIWKLVFRNCKREDIHTWAMNTFPHRWTLPDITFYTITEESTGYD